MKLKTEDDWRALYELYTNGASLLDCALETHFNPKTISKGFKERGLAVRSRNSGKPRNLHPPEHFTPTSPIREVVTRKSMTGHRRRSFY